MRDLCMQFYDQPYLRDADVRRVFVIDPERRAVLLTTPMRVMSAWSAKESRAASGDTTATGAAAATAAPYLSVSGWQPPIDEQVAKRYLSVLHAGRSGSIVSAAGLASFHAVNETDAFLSSSSAEGAAATTQPTQQKNPNIMVTNVLSNVSLAQNSWLPFVVECLSDVDSGSSFVSGRLDFTMPPSTNSEVCGLLLREEESDVAMGSPMIKVDTIDGQPEVIEGVQFRNGYGAKWDPLVAYTPLLKPYYSPQHRAPAKNRIWVIAGA